MNWVHPEKFNLANYSHDGSIECFLQVDPDYPEEVYDYPLAAEKTQKKLNLNLGNKRKSNSSNNSNNSNNNRTQIIINFKTIH